jgi:thiol-disulfide isomerase/thioredoxin
MMISYRRFSVSRILLSWAIFSVCMALPANSSRAADPAAPGARRTTAQIFADIQAVQGQTPRFSTGVQVNPKYRQQMTREMTPPVKRLVELLNELETVDRAKALPWRSEKCMALARLAVWEDADALKSLTDASNSSIAPEAVFGKTGLLMQRWWNDSEAEAQGKIVAEFQALAKGSPTDEVLFHAALQMARYSAASDEIANSLRDVVEKDLKSPAAEKYRHQAYKIGRPFKIAVGCIDGKAVSTTTWKGKVVLIDFWATWCPPCVASVPKLVQLYQTNHARGLEVLGISNDSSLAALKEFLAGHKEMVWPESFGPSGRNGWHSLAPQMGIEAIPTSFLIDRNGILREIQTGFLDEALVNQLLDEPVKADAPTDATAKSSSPAAPAAKSDASGPPPAAAPSADPSDKQADAMLALANSYISIKRPDRAAEKLSLLIEKYPNSSAAKKAKELLAQL